MFELEKKLENIISEGFLLHGSRFNIQNNFLAPNNKKEVFATNNYEIALMKAIVSSNNLNYPGLVYPLFIDEKNPLELHIYGMNPDTIGKEGYIYVVSKKSFKNEPKNSCQYVNKNKNVPIIEVIKVYKDDLKIPIFNITETKIQ
ncbi:MAG: hypothetical protein WC376_02375 [Candidatus Nanoarchaeia archaeon]|jgi:hypothetical protein